MTIKKPEHKFKTQTSDLSIGNLTSFEKFYLKLTGLGEWYLLGHFPRLFSKVLNISEF